MPVRKSRYIQHPPNAIQIELTEGCNLSCSFCGINGIRESKGGPYNFLDINDAAKIALGIKAVGWNPRIEFAMHGEPTMNPNYLAIVAAFRAVLPRTHLMMTSNGIGFLKRPGINRRINELMDVGLNVLLLDDYQGIMIVKKIREGYDGPYPVYEYPDNRWGNPHRRRKFDVHDIVVVQDIASATSGNHSKLNNHAGSASPKNYNADGKRCAKPFREMSIRWNGAVSICCNDWRGEYKCGNVCMEPIDDVWQSPAFVVARKKLYHGERDFGPCNGCDALSYRVGFLPDYKGLDKLPRANKRDKEIISEALRGKSFSIPILRPWEK